MQQEAKVDLRIRRTQKAILKSFFYLVDTKGFEHIMVKDITDGAKISRNTFYLHFSDKYDLLDKICYELMAKLFAGVEKQIAEEKELHFNVEDAAKILRIALNTIDEDRRVYRILLSDPGTTVFSGYIERAIRHALDFIKDDIEGIGDCSLEYIVCGMKGVIRYWVTHENVDLEQEAANFSQIHLSSIINMLRKHGQEDKCEKNHTTDLTE